ncbi:MAG: hypothetical protein LBN95_06320 [Prevotellaceae bacterium]|jgi:hypothetical protein|nr:hypothetical protein [Prevotellaceae bacterium]
MKKLIFAAFAAVLFLGCTAPPVITEPIFTLKDINGQELKKGQTVTVTDFDAAAAPDKLLFDGNIDSEEAFNLEVTVTRENVADASDELCVSNCIPSNHQATQNFGFAVGDGQTRFYAHFGERETEIEYDDEGNVTSEIEHHLSNGDYRIIYDFHEKEYPTASIKITVIYKYNK